MDITIHETFGTTVQGEGLWTGSVVSFIRLSGCPVGCRWCDTGYANGGKGLPRKQVSIDKLVMDSTDRVIISGGEPFIHQNLPYLIDTLIAAQKKVHIETSGAFYLPVHPDTWITLSPKEHLNPRYPVDDRVWDRCNEVKLVIEYGTELETYSERLKSISVPIFLQPEYNSFNTSIQHTLKLLYANPRYRLSIQTHKFIGVL